MPAGTRSLAGLLACYCVSVLLFSAGFFLTRVELHETSECKPPWGMQRAQSGCWSDPRYSKIIILLVDALRFDFIAPGSDREVNNEMPYARELLRRQDGSSALFRFLSDPPTVTAARLKGITTGSMPTFFDVSDSFASPAVKEDNWVLQAQRAGWHTVFAGDDTWGLLFPGAFSSMYLFPSFNVWDLHTVDNGVLSVLFPMLNLSLPRNAVDCYNPPCAILPPSLRGVRLKQSSDMIQQPVRAGVDESWRLFVGHFLGVDHVGHHLNANAPEMTVKLRQVDAILAAIIPALPNDTLLVVMGDHGMTDDGNHGGSTDFETGTSLLLYSSAGVVYPSIASAATVSAVPQIDLVPTLCLVLGLPIPFNSLGKPIPNLLYGPSDGDPIAASLHGLLQTAHQVHMYITAYQAATSSFSPSVMASLHGLFEEAVDRANQALSTHAASSHLPVPSDVDAALQLLRQFVSDVQEMCRSSWTQFDVRLIAWGCIGFLLCTFMAIRGVPQTHSLLTLRAVAMAFLASSVHVVMFGSAASNEPLTRMLTSPSQAPLGIVLVICWCGLVLNGTAPVALPSLPIGLLFLMRLLGLTSNSFVVEERWVLMFLLSSALLVWLYRGYKCGMEVRSLGWHAIGLLVPGRVALEVSASQSKAVPSLFECLISSTILCIPVILQHSTTRRSVSTLLDAMIWLTVSGYWWCTSLLQQRSFIHLLLPRVVYCLAFIRLFVNGRSPDRVELVPLKIVNTLLPVVLILTGCRSSLPYLLICMQVAAMLSLYRHIRPVSDQYTIDSTITWALATSLHFYTTGHTMQYSSIDFNSAFTGFDDVWIPRSALMTALSTFGTTVLLTAVARSVLPYRAGLSTPHLLVALQFCVVTVSSIFTGIERRHLMAWSIFAPKLTFELVIGCIVCITSLTAVSFGSHARPPLTTKMT